VGVDNPIATAPGWFTYSLTVIVGLLGALAGVYRGKIIKLEEAQGTYAKSSKVDEIERKQQSMAEIQGRFVTHDELRLELEARFNEMDTRRLQMHNHTIERLNILTTSIEGLRADMREDLGRVHERIDTDRRRRDNDRI